MARDVAVPLELEEMRLPPRVSAWRRIASIARHQPLGVFGVLCVGLFLFCGIFADIIVPYGPLGIGKSTGTVATLVSAVDAGDTTLRISGTQFPQFDIPSTIVIGGEKMSVVSVDPGFVGSPDMKVTVVRGAEGTAAESHPANSVWQDQTHPERLSGRVTFPVRGADTILPLSGISIPIRVVIDDESVSLGLMKLDPTRGGELTVDVKRGQEGTTTAAHKTGAALTITRVIQRESPSLSHPFGTDRLGRDVLSRTIFGARVSLLIGLVAVISGVTAGSLFGVIAGYFGRLTDSIIMRTVDVLLAFPVLVLLLAIITVVGDKDSSVRKFLANFPILNKEVFIGIPNFLDVFIVSLVIGLAIAVFTTRVVRGSVLSLKENVYIEAARAMGASNSRIMWKQIFPNVAALVVILGSVLLPVAILAEAALSFLGVGVPAPTPSWGADLSGSNQTDAQTGYWWVVFFPGLALSLVVLGFNMLGDAFRDISDPRLRGSGLSGGGSGGSGGSGGGAAF